MAVSDFLVTSPRVNNSGISIERVTDFDSQSRVHYPPQHQYITAYKCKQYNCRQ
jgi:hypothetical protein